MKTAFAALCLAAIIAIPGNQLHAMPPKDWDQPEPIELGELITTISTSDGTLKAHKGSINKLPNNSYSVSINYVLNNQIYRVLAVINPDGTGTCNEAGVQLQQAIASKPALNLALSQQQSEMMAQLPGVAPSEETGSISIPKLSDCQESWIGLAVSVVTKSWLGAIWGLYKVITKCF